MIATNKMCLTSSFVISLTTHARMLSQVVPVPGVGQVGQGLENSWGLEDDDEDDYEEEKNDNSGDEQVEEVTKMDVGEGGLLFIYLDSLM